jgi:hypothetical protein
MLKEKIRLILPGSSSQSQQDKVTELAYHVLKAWDVLVTLEYRKENTFNLYHRLMYEQHIAPFQAIHHWFAPLETSGSHEKETFIKIIEWTIQLLHEAQSKLMYQQIQQARKFYRYKFIEKPGALSLQKQIQFLLIDYITHTEGHIQDYQRMKQDDPSLLYQKTTAQQYYDSIDNVTQDCIQQIQQTIREHHPNYYLKQFNKGVGAFIQRLMIYYDTPQLWTNYKEKILALAPPPFQLHGLTSWLEEYQFNKEIEMVEDILHTFTEDIYHYLDQNNLDLPSNLPNESALKKALLDYIDYIKSIMGIEDILVYFFTEEAPEEKSRLMAIKDINPAQLCQANINDLKITSGGYLEQLQIICSNASQQTKDQYAELETYSKQLEQKLNTISSQIINLIKNPDAILKCSNLLDTIQTILNQRLNTPSENEGKSPCPSHYLPPHNRSYTPRHFSSNDSMQFNDVFGSPLSSTQSSSHQSGAQAYSSSPAP